MKYLQVLLKKAEYKFACKDRGLDSNQKEQHALHLDNEFIFSCLVPPREIEEPKGCIKPNGVFARFSSSWRTNNCTVCRCTKDYGVMCQKDCTVNEENCEKLIDIPGKCCPVCLLKSKFILNATTFSGENKEWNCSEILYPF